MTLRTLATFLTLAMAASLAAAPKKENSKRKPKNKRQDIEAIGDRDVGKGVNFFSIEKEIALGKRLAQNIERHSKIVDDPIVAEYINRVGQNIVRNSDAKVPFTIKLIDSQQVNAFALPGGFFFVNAGLVLRAESESELAGVMAHEIAHVAARHGTRQATRGKIVNYATIPLLFMGGWTGYGIRQAVGFAIPMGFLRFSRKFETEADFLGLQYIYQSGYDPTSVTDFFGKMQADEKRRPGTMAKIFSSHPPHGDRIVKTQKAIDELLPNKREYVVSTSEFLDVKDRLIALTRPGKEKREDPNRPRLRRVPSAGTVSVDGSDSDADMSDEDERPTLKRR